MRAAEVKGLSPDGRALVVADGDDELEVPLEQVQAALARSPALATSPATVSLPAAGAVAEPQPDGRPPTPREVQARIRRGESSERIARLAGVPLPAITRYEGPVLREREHQARLARLSAVDGRPVDPLVTAHFARSVDDVEPEWDSWLVEGTLWRVVVTAGSRAVELDWDAAARRLRARDEQGRQALGLAPAPEDALGAVLRPVNARAGARPRPRAVPDAPAEVAPPAPAPAARPAPAVEHEHVPGQLPLPDDEPALTPVRPPARPPARPAARGRRAAVPAWDDITTSVTGRPAGRGRAAEEPDAGSGERP